MKEIRKDVLNYIICDINKSLARLGVNAPLGDIKPTARTEGYEAKTLGLVKQEPVIFETLMIEAYITKRGAKDGLCYVNVGLSWRWTHFGGGSNGCDLGRVEYCVNEEALPEKEVNDFRDMSYYVRRTRGLTI
jgi:hypothetical protein